MKMLNAILITFICAIVIILVWFFIRNFGSVKITQNILKVAGFLVAALIFLLLDVYSTQNYYEKNVNILIPRNEQDIEIHEFGKNLIKINSEHKGYDVMIDVVLFSKKNTDKIFSDKDVKALDLMEVVFWTWLSKKYNLHWQVETKNFTGISGGGGQGDKAKNAEKEFTTVKAGELNKMLEDNYFKLPKGQVWHLILPNGSTITSLTRNNYERTYLIKNPNIEFKISIIHPGNSCMANTKLGDNIIKTLPNDKGEWYSNHIRVEFSTKVNRFRIFSDITKKQLQWINEIQDDFENDFEWSLIKEDFKEIYNS
jgi:hypothetical protein